MNTRMKRQTVSLLLVTGLISLGVLMPAGDPLMALTMETRGIVIDGSSADFTEDEVVFNMAEELDFDSWWGEFNDINNIKVTWDSDSLYVAVDGYSWDNNVMLFFDTDPLRGIRKQDRLNAWPRLLEFLHRHPDFFLATWDNNTEPQCWFLKPGSAFTVEQADSLGTKLFHAAASFSQSTPGACMEGAMPWSLLYKHHSGSTVPAGSEIGLLAVIVTGDDHRSGPDCAPNNMLGMHNDSGNLAVLDNYAIVRIDRDGDGEPDIGVAPTGREGDDISEIPPLYFLRDPAAPPVDLKFNQARAVTAAFSPNGDGIVDQAEIRFTISADFTIDIVIFSPRGDRIRTIAWHTEVENDQEISVFWDGRDDGGELVDAGVYIASLNLGYGDRVNIPLAVLR